MHKKSLAVFGRICWKTNKLAAENVTSGYVEGDRQTQKVS